MEDLLILACFTGFFGDMTLQFMNKDKGLLHGYFIQHGRAESVCIAAGMMTIFYAIYIKLNLPLNIPCIALYAIVLDLLFRKFRIFPSLDTYYSTLNYFWSAIWAIIPMLIPFILYKLIK